MRYLIELVLALALVGAVAGCAGQTPRPCTAPTTSGEQSECVCDCRTLHDCCIKSCNWVDMPYAAESQSKTKCIKDCNSALERCNQKCK